MPDRPHLTGGDDARRRRNPKPLVVEAQFIADGGLVQDRLRTEDGLDPALDAQHARRTEPLERRIVHQARVLDAHAQTGDAGVDVLDVFGPAECRDDLVGLGRHALVLGVGTGVLMSHFRIAKRKEK